MKNLNLSFRAVAILAIFALCSPKSLPGQHSGEQPDKHNPQNLTGKMAIFNYLLGAPWTCRLVSPDGKPSGDFDVTITFEVVASNVLHSHITSPQWFADSYFGFDAKNKIYYRSEAGSFGGAMRQTSVDGIVFSGTSIRPSGTVATERDTFRQEADGSSDGSSTDMHVLTANGADESSTSRCTR